jgi:cytochrome c-type protein NapB
MLSRYTRIVAISGAMAAFVFIGGGVVRGGKEAESPAELIRDGARLQAEGGSFDLDAARYKEATEEKNTRRSLALFYSRRAFPGAPPIIPHELFEDRTMGAKNCLSCHRDGGFVPPFKAYAPVTPHPQLGNCRQCHVPNKEKGTFRASTWEKIPGPAINREALAGGPPPIPHELQMRENCVACHAGPGAVAEIRTPHPERVNCRQCHVEASKNGPDEQAFWRPLR